MLTNRPHTSNAKLVTALPKHLLDTVLNLDFPSGRAVQPFFFPFLLFFPLLLHLSTARKHSPKWFSLLVYLFFLVQRIKKEMGREGWPTGGCFVSFYLILCFFISFLISIYHPPPPFAVPFKFCYFIRQRPVWTVSWNQLYTDDSQENIESLTAYLIKKKKHNNTCGI